MAEVMSKAAYLRLLIDTSVAGGFPARLLDDGPSVCRYRTASGRKCSIGLLIPDDKYDPAMEGLVAERVFFQQYPDAVVRVEGFAEGDNHYSKPGDYRAVQRAHDTLADTLRTGEAWPHENFVLALRALPCFQGVEPA